MDRNALPSNICGQWHVSALADEDLTSKIHLHLQSKGKFIAAIDIILKSRFGLTKTISLRMAQRWMKVMQYHWQKQPQADIIAYRQNVFLPFWTGYFPHCEMGKPMGQRTTPKPLQKGEGASLMVSNFASADYGWLHSPDGSETARILFKVGKNRDGYFTNDDIMMQAAHAMDILDKYYPNENHVLVFDNTTTHQKRPDDALSASKMPKMMPRPPRNFLVDATVRDAAGKAAMDSSRNTMKEKRWMRNGKLLDGSLQSFYFPLGHRHAGQFKGMETILEERGIDTQGLNAQCQKFKCQDHVLPSNSRPCCCRKALFEQSDFSNQKSRLEELGDQRGYRINFYPRFHCECNFIENNWGYTKRVYRQYPKSSSEKDLERNVIRALESVPVILMHRFFTHSLRFMDAYRKGLNGVQAAWANKKYRGHRVLPDTLMADLDKEMSV
ncbi:hypothetical protein BS47DRAFT_1372507 [Hydnum rufescens UP504]|uniref:Uncharacterized protein n=1 Tax=Hydnum rufescens UP504 TaxID=1448309 RepID=A0A9P6DWA0_9AGAM|nr:hypothetical protein BS47DRAFT_1372507 [Hydnum rufescens UP504]